jgi:Uma2 family endonuclease
MAIHDGRVKLSYEDYVHFPEDGRRHELIEGDHHVTPAPNTRHQQISSRLDRHLGTFVAERGLGEVITAPFDVVLGPTDVVQPDLLFLRTEHLDRLTEAHLRGAPDLAVEIVSESTRGRDEITKRHLYARYGVAEYWIVDPVTETVKIHRLTDEGGYHRVAELRNETGDSLDSPLFPGFSLPLADLFG